MTEARIPRGIGREQDEPTSKKLEAFLIGKPSKFEIGSLTLQADAKDDTMENDAMTPQIVDGSRQLSIEIKAQRELAISNPRDEKTVLAKCLGELQMAPEFAEEAYYSIPYNEGKENETLVEGLSVKASRMVIRRWGNCAVASRIANETEESIELEGVYADFETNTFIRRPFIVKKFYLQKGSKIPIPLKGTMLTNAIQAGFSKVERNAALAGMPEFIKSRIFTAAKQIAGSKGKGVLTDAERLDKCYAAFGKFGVEPVRVIAYIKKNLAGKSVDEVIGAMTGIYNALRDKHTTVDDVFPTEQATEKPGAIKLDDIPGAKL